MDEAVVEPMTEGPLKGKRDKKGRFLKGVPPNPLGHKGPRQLTAMEFINALKEEKGEDAAREIIREAFRLLATGNTTLLCKILDKILPSKLESKSEILITQREEARRIGQRAMELLNAAGINRIAGSIN